MLGQSKYPWIRAVRRYPGILSVVWLARSVLDAAI